jgi:putative transposase
MEKRLLKASVENEIVLVYVREIRKQQPRIGTRKLYWMLGNILKSNSIKIGRDKFFELLRHYDLLVKPRRRRIKTTDSNHVFWKYPNLIREYVPTGPEQIWVSDLTYLSTAKGFVYLSLVTDQYSKNIMGYYVSPTLELKGPLEALKMALKNRSHLESKLIHHSDRGIQYCCAEYINVLKEHNIQISMSSKGNPYENAVAERVNGILKSEFYLDRFFKNIIQVRLVVKDVVSIYNTQRPHASCDYLTPDEAHWGEGILQKRWKNYKPDKPCHEPEPISKEVEKVLDQLLKKDLVDVDN